MKAISEAFALIRDNRKAFNLDQYRLLCHCTDWHVDRPSQPGVAKDIG